MKWCSAALLALPCGFALAGAPVSAGGTVPPISAAVDAELLEFLGSVDSTEPGWHDYLEDTDLEKAVTVPEKKAPPPADQGNST
jgi:hypothetical protein